MAIEVKQEKNEKWEKVKSLDLKGVKKLLKEKKGWWWKASTNLDKLEDEYRQFLYLIVANPGKTVVPWSQKLDDFWHQHILDTAKYTADCMEINGGYIHHNPNLPIGSAEHNKSFGETKKMYKEAFKAKAEKKGSPAAASSTDAGCTAFMPIVFCGSGESHSSHHDSSHSGSHHDSGHHDGGSHGHGCSSSSHSCSGGHSCGGHSCGGGSSCGGSSCGGGGGCGGGGD